MNSENVADIQLVLRELKQLPEFASKAAEIVDLKGDDEFHIGINAELGGRPENGKGIKYKPVVKSNNENYEPQETMSYGAIEDTFQSIGKNYANLLMQDPNLESLLQPYPEPKLPKNLQDDGKKKEDKSPLDMFFDSVKGVANFFMGDDNHENHEEKPEEARKSEEERELDMVEQQLVAIKTSGSVLKAAKYNIDWRQTGCISPVQNQKSCDSCYAFTVLGLMEYFYCRQMKQLTTFSAQYIVDCGQGVGLNGCRGSRIANVGKFIRQYGIELAAKYPYNSRENECPYNFNDSEQVLKSGYLRPSITHWQNFQEMAAWYKWLRKSPVIVGINMPTDFLAYGGGVHDGLDCVAEMTHAMLLVGSGIQDGREFWLLKNSYSDSWGEEGYFKLSKSAPLRCFNSAIVARAKFNS